MKEQRLIPLNLQLFANEGNEGGQGEGSQEKSYSEAEYLKLKESFDKSASELAKLKKEQQEFKKALMGRKMVDPMDKDAGIKFGNE